MRPRHCTDADGLCFPDETMYRRQIRNPLCQVVRSVVEQASVVACEDLSTSMQLVPCHHRDTHCRLDGWVKGERANTLTLISRCRTSAPVLVSPACTSQTGSRTSPLPRCRQRGGFCCGDGVVTNADANAAYNIRTRLHDCGVVLYIPYRVVKTILLDQTKLLAGMALPVQRRAMRPLSTESKVPETARF